MRRSTCSGRWISSFSIMASQTHIRSLRAEQHSSCQSSLLCCLTILPSYKVNIYMNKVIEEQIIPVLWGSLRIMSGSHRRSDSWTNRVISLRTSNPLSVKLSSVKHSSSLQGNKVLKAFRGIVIHRQREWWITGSFQASALHPPPQQSHSAQAVLLHAVSITSALWLSHSHTYTHFFCLSYTRVCVSFTLLSVSRFFNSHFVQWHFNLLPCYLFDINIFYILYTCIYIYYALLDVCTHDSILILF